MTGRKRSRAEVDAELARVSHERACLASALAYVVRETVPDARVSYSEHTVYPDHTAAEEPLSLLGAVFVSLYDVNAAHGGIVIRTTDVPSERLRVEAETLDDWRARMLRVERAGDCFPEREACERLNRARTSLLRVAS